jgi:hypothetical protein
MISEKIVTVSGIRVLRIVEGCDIEIVEEIISSVRGKVFSGISSESDSEEISIISVDFFEREVKRAEKTGRSRCLNVRATSFRNFM